MNLESGQSSNRDYSSISPSAKWLLQLKGLTGIPFAGEAAKLMESPDAYNRDLTAKDFNLWARVVHFESRYQSVDQLLSEVKCENILELSSGFSFRGLDKVKVGGVHYIDTDLEDVIQVKKHLISELNHNEPGAGSKLELLPLNALDEEQFKSTVKHFSPGEIVLVNEGLLVYLDLAEKEKLCKIIHDVLKERGGYWITGDIYVKQTPETIINIDDKLKEFFEQHQIEQNKFDSFEAAEQFFNKVGFVIDKEGTPDYTKITALPHFMESATAEQLKKIGNSPRIHKTWRLKLA